MVSECLGRVEGPNLILRLIRLEDACYVHALRTDPAYNRHLSIVRGTVDDQRRWIEDYKSREADLRELYYLIERKDGTRCGLVRLYEISSGNFNWGSWVLDHNKTRKAALESALLSFDVGFHRLGLTTALVDVRSENVRALAFYRRLGMTELHRNASNIYLAYPRNQFSADRAKYLAILEEESAG